MSGAPDLANPAASPNQGHGAGDPGRSWLDAEAMERARLALIALRAKRGRPSPDASACFNCGRTTSRQWYRARGLSVNYWKRIYYCAECSEGTC